MRYQMKQKILSWGNDFTIRDSEGNKAYHVDGKVFTFGDKLIFKDTAGQEVARIEQKLLTLGATYDVYRGDRHVARVKKKMFTFFRDKFYVDVPGPDDLEVSGSILDREYRFERHGKTVAKVSKAFFSWTDTYGIDIEDGEDDVLILACAVVVDMVSHQSNS